MLSVGKVEVRNSNLRRPRSVVRALAVAVLTAALVSPNATATWSIIVIDTQSHEIAVGAATCLTDFDLQAGLPVLLVEVGAAAAQSLVDVGAVNRIRVHSQLLAGTPPADIVYLLSTLDASHESRQYGIANVGGESATFTGVLDGAFAGGLTGETGSLVYAIQGNVLTGAPVLVAAEQAILETSGDLPVKLMAAMEAAQSMGGDGRCSCLPNAPTLCGSPPVTTFSKSAHIGFMIVSRPGDLDGGCTGPKGCANGSYFMNFNVASQPTGALDPVLQMGQQFVAWRSGLVGVPDAARSSVVVQPDSFLADGAGVATMTITIRDWQGTIVADDAVQIGVVHAATGAAATIIGPVLQIDEGVFALTLQGTERAGLDRFDVSVTGGSQPVIVIPRPTLRSIALADLDRDGDVDVLDLTGLRTCLGGPASAPSGECEIADVAADGAVDLRDVAAAQRAFTGASCRRLSITEHPQSVSVRCGFPFTLGAAAEADPPAYFQWFRNGAPIPGATDMFYHVEFTGNGDLGEYDVEVTNTCRTLRSRPATVSTPRPPCPP